MDSLTRVKELVCTVGSFQLSQQKELPELKVEEKSFNQLVSYVDKESEWMLVEGLKGITPNATFITEEDTVENIKSDEYWIIDPLDGTTNYLFGLDMFSISIAYYKKNKPVYANVYLPVKDEMFEADENGATLNGKPIQVSSRYRLSETLIATGFPYYNFNELSSYLEVLKTLMEGTKGLRRMGSAAIDLAYTACGRFDGFFELNLSPWDVAAGAYIIQQAGGTVSDFNGGDDFVFGNSILAGNTAIHSEIKKIIDQYNF